MGHSFVTTNYKSLVLNNKLHVPFIIKNLISVSKFTKDNDVIAEFYSDCCLVKDKNMRKVLLKGTLKEGLYQLDVAKLQDRP